MLLPSLVLALLGAPDPPVELALTETSGARLVVVEGRLFRERGATRTAIGDGVEPAPGRVLALAADPAGLTFVAAEGGLYVLGPSVAVLDPVEPEGDVPGGRPTSVHVDAARRVWFASAEGVGVLEPSHFHGRRLVSPGLAPGPSYALAGTPDGRLAIRWEGGEHVHDPAAAPAPRVTSVRVDGEPVTSGATLRRPSGGELVLELTGEAAGGAAFRYRVDGHHVWRSLPPDGRLAMPNPGRRTLELVAEDEDLDTSAPFLVKLEIAYPFYFAGRFVLGSALVVGLALLALFARGLRDASGRAQPLRALVSAALALVLVLQVLAGLVPHAKGWPFVGFGMYTKRFPRDGLIYAERIVVLRPDGSERIVPVQSAGVIVDEPWEVIRPLIDRGEPALRAYLEAWRARNPGEAASGLQVQAQRSRLTAHGPVSVAPLVLAHFRENAGG
ncbi:MAG TPA: hypothetical protein VF530_12485 [Planctomycetota bacterium]